MATETQEEPLVTVGRKFKKILLAGRNVFVLDCDVIARSDYFLSTIYCRQYYYGIPVL